MDHHRVHWIATGNQPTQGGWIIMMTSLLTRLHAMRAEQARRRTLWRELSTYSTLDDLNDIEATIARSDDAETDPETQDISRFLAARRNLVTLG
jgi:hypothetical protein